MGKVLAPGPFGMGGFASTAIPAGTRVATLPYPLVLSEWCPWRAAGGPLVPPCAPGTGGVPVVTVPPGCFGAAAAPAVAAASRAALPALPGDSPVFAVQMAVRAAGSARPAAVVAEGGGLVRGATVSSLPHTCPDGRCSSPPLPGCLAGRVVLCLHLHTPPLHHCLAPLPPPRHPAPLRARARARTAPAPCPCSPPTPGTCCTCTWWRPGGRIPQRSPAVPCGPRTCGRCPRCTTCPSRGPRRRWHARCMCLRVFPRIRWQRRPCPPPNPPPSHASLHVRPFRTPWVGH
jgi:hypothetical protein